jgi:hypothetical protein
MSLDDLFYGGGNSIPCISFAKMLVGVILIAILIPALTVGFTDKSWWDGVNYAAAPTALLFGWWVASYFIGVDCRYIGAPRPLEYVPPVSVGSIEQPYEAPAQKNEVNVESQPTTGGTYFW